MTHTPENHQSKGNTYSQYRQRVIPALLIFSLMFSLFLPFMTALSEGEPVFYYTSSAISWQNTTRTRNTQKKYIALTFDDGPSIYTISILNSLRVYGAKATFCVIGSRVETYQSAIKQASRQGCEVIGHTWSHPDLTALSAQDIRSQITSTNREIERLTGVKCRMFRPPYGYINQTVKNVSAELNMSILMWSVDTNDWKDNDADRIYKHIIENAKDGSIIL